MFRLFECCALSFFERFVLSFSLKIERFVSDSAEIWICGLYIRFYDRQFITRENANNDLLARFELLLNNYYHSALPTSKGIPTVQYCADQLCLSTNYFSDLVKKETGMSAIKHIQQKIMDIAKERIMNTQKSISQISDEMGFQYPQHFTRWFKKMEGCTPNEYRNEIIKQAIN